MTDGENGTRMNDNRILIFGEELSSNSNLFVRVNKYPGC